MGLLHVFRVAFFLSLSLLSVADSPRNEAIYKYNAAIQAGRDGHPLSTTIALYREAILIDPTLAEAHLNLGCLLAFGKSSL